MPRPTPEAVDAGRELIGRFNDAINRRDLDQFRSLWTEDAIWDIKTMSAATGPQAITELIASMLQNWEVFFQLSGEPVFEADGQTLVARSPMWEFGRSHTGSSYSGYALNVDEIVRGEQGWRFARRIWHPLLVNQADIPGTAVSLPADLRV